MKPILRTASAYRAALDDVPELPAVGVHKTKDRTNTPQTNPIDLLRDAMEFT